jgi:hypothetical protein
VHVLLLCRLTIHILVSMSIRIRLRHSLSRLFLR